MGSYGEEKSLETVALMELVVPHEKLALDSFVILPDKREAYYGCANNEFGGCGSILSVHQVALKHA
ncbi:hypothetical protein NMG60_11019768 [Bertholletia excelsa]